MLLRRTNEGEGSEEEVDGDGDDDDASTTVDDENGLDPANPRGQALETARWRRWSGEVADSGAANVDSGCCCWRREENDLPPTATPTVHRPLAEAVAPPSRETNVLQQRWSMLLLLLLPPRRSSRAAAFAGAVDIAKEEKREKCF
jgi:hypothetical protein